MGDLSIGYWLCFILVVILLVLFEASLLTESTSGSKTNLFKRGLVNAALFFVFSLLFAVFLYRKFGESVALDFVTGYFLELTLSVDNIFVFIVIFSYMRTSIKQQQRILMYGIYSAVVLRFCMIIFGTQLIERMHSMFYLFGALLIYSSYKMLSTHQIEDQGEDGNDVGIEDRRLVTFLSRYVPIHSDRSSSQFFLKENGKVFVTSSFVTLLLIEKADIMFALDSVPAILAITLDPYVIFTSNICAIMGLRSMYFIISGLLKRMHYLHYGLACLLLFIGIKLILSALHINISTIYSLIAVILMLVIVAILSLYRAYITRYR